MWFEDFSDSAVRAIHEITIPFEVRVRSVCAATRLNPIRVERMYHKVGHSVASQFIKSSDTMSSDYGNGYDLCGPRIYSVVT